MEGVTPGTWYPVFDLDDQLDDYTAARDMWSNLCPPYDGGEEKCCVKITWSKNVNDFNGANQSPYETAACTKNMVINKQTCGPKCPDNPSNPANGPLIIINITNEWIFESAIPGHDYLAAKRMWYTGETVPQNVAVRNDVRLISLREIIAHEVGHWYGLRHLNQNEGEPYNNQQCPSYPGSVMIDGPDPNGTTKYDRDSRQLSQADMCAFKKLYCPAEINDNKIMNNIVLRSDMAIYPNPIMGERETVSIGVDLHDYGDLYIAITDVNGSNIVQMRQDISRTGMMYVRIETRGMSSGYYFCVATQRVSGGKQAVVGYGILRIIR
jgi:hypothetical protein